MLKHGLVLKNVQRAISFNQHEWLKPYIEMNSKLRIKQKIITQRRIKDNTEALNL